MSNTWSDAQLGMIGAQAAKLPQHQVLHWMAIRAVPETVRALMREVNDQMTAIENDRDLSPDGKQHKRAELAKEALAKLEKFVEPAERAAAKRVAGLEEKMSAHIAQGKPKDATEAQLATEIRAHIAGQESPIMAALKLKSDPKVIAAVLEAPSFLSGLSDEEASTLRAQALASSEQQREVDEITKGVGVCKSAVKSAAAMISARANVRQSALGAWETAQ
jgi:hypothetical protein